MILHRCEAITLEDMSAEQCTLCRADLSYAPYNELVEAIQRVRELHKPVKTYGWLCCSYCAYVRDEDYQEYPCETIKALDGEQ